MWYETFDAIFFTSIATVIAGAFGLALRYCIKSKCEHFSLCYGLITVDRRVDLEVQEEIKQMELQNDLERAENEGEEKEEKEEKQDSPKSPTPVPKLELSKVDKLRNRI